jgi:hypothetical protein
LIPNVIYYTIYPKDGELPLISGAVDGAVESEKVLKEPDFEEEIPFHLEKDSLLSHIAKVHGLDELLVKIFPYHYREILKVPSKCSEMIVEIPKD